MNGERQLKVCMNKNKKEGWMNGAEMNKGERE